ncbi:MAG: Gfo/Idh/MocA family oxidoreductase [Chitinophagaceae bacterium]|nr:Gfo/Idh/MocA family oxidoreductase [Chitinophagaceae bacterium]
MMKRRKFLQYSLSGVAAANMPFMMSASVLGANDRLRIGVIGVGGMGQNHVQEYNALHNVEVAAICDVDENRISEVVQKHFVGKGLKKPRTYVDLRKLLEDKDIDAVSIVTPNHWHALAAVWAMQAGKHVSVEKPCCYNIFEGLKLLEAANKYNVIVQDGAEQRSNPCAISAAQFLHDGHLGEVYMAKGVCFKRRDTIGVYPDGPLAPGMTHPIGNFTKEYLSKVNYDLWLGPAPKRNFNPNRFHYNWHWNWDYGNGDMGNQGVHEMDVARWGLGVELPTRISAVGGHFMFTDDQQTPNDLIGIFEFPNPDGGGDKKKILQFEVRHWYSNEDVQLSDKQSDSTGYMRSSKNNIGNLFFGSKGYMVKNVDEWKTFMGTDGEPGMTGRGLGNHYQSFVDAIRANDLSKLKGKIKDGVYSCIVMHLGNISYRLGRSLEFDPAKMRFVNDKEADAMMSREQYRAPFVFPDKV